jgi:hypothetical protein
MHPIFRSGEQDFERVRIGFGAQSHQLGQLEDDALGLAVERLACAGMDEQTRPDSLPERGGPSLLIELALSLLEGVEERESAAERGCADAAQVDIGVEARGAVRVAARQGDEECVLIDVERRGGHGA